jgi:hypothetical protein
LQFLAEQAGIPTVKQVSILQHPPKEPSGNLTNQVDREPVFPFIIASFAGLKQVHWNDQQKKYPG